MKPPKHTGSSSHRRLHPLARADWTLVDWAKSNAQIATETGCSESHVSKQRCTHAPGTRHHVWGGGVDWEIINWSKRTRDIAVETGKAEATVSRMRDRYAGETLQGKTSYKYCDIGGRRCLSSRCKRELYCGNCPDFQRHQALLKARWDANV